MKNILNYTDKHSRSIFLFLCLIFVIVASLHSLVSHYLFFSNNWDLGFHNQLMYKWAHFRNPSSTLWNPYYELKNCLGDHFTLLMPINSQLYWIFGSYGMLVAQIFYMIIGATGIYKLIQFKCKSNNLALLGVFLFFTHYSLYAALAFDAHDNIYGMMFLPWVLFFYYKKNFSAFIFSLFIFLAAREDLAFTGISLGLSLLIFDRGQKKFAVACFLIPLFYFIIVYNFIMPSLFPLPVKHVDSRFGNLGSSFPEVIQTVITKPFYTLQLFLDQKEKQEKFNYFLMTGGILVFIQPRFIFIFFPTFCITCLSSAWGLWGNLYHYNIVFAVMLPFLVITTAELIKNLKLKYILLSAAVIMNLITLKNIRFSDWTGFGRIFTEDYYKRRSNLTEIHEGLSLIPDTSSISAINFLTPHLAFRDKAYFFPDVKDAEYIAINVADTAYNLYPVHSVSEFMNNIQQLRDGHDYEVIYEKNKMLVFRKKISSNQQQ